MTLRLTIDEQAWRSHVSEVRACTPGLVPVVKGNGYGFGRSTLIDIAVTLADEVAVGTIEEATGVSRSLIEQGLVSVIALTPAIHLPPGLPGEIVPTVGGVAHVEALVRQGWSGRMAVKLESSMHRHGASPGTIHMLHAAIAAAGFGIHQYVLHLALPSPTYRTSESSGEARRWLEQLDPAIPVSFSHLTNEAYHHMVTDYPDRTFRLRSGTKLWHGDKSFLRLTADIIESRPVHAGQIVGYRQATVPGPGRLVMIGAGSAHGIAPNEPGLSPVHFARRRLALLEPPHMHTTMVFVPDGQPTPTIGQWVDVQRPLIAVSPDALDWR